MLTVILVLIALAAGFELGTKNPTVLAEAKAELANATAKAKAVEAAVLAKLHGLE